MGQRADDVSRIIDKAGDDRPDYPPPVSSWGPAPERVIAWGGRLPRYDVDSG